MRHLYDDVKESLLDDEDALVSNSKETMERIRIWKDLTETYGEILMGSKTGRISVDNIGFNKKGEIIFLNWPGRSITFNLDPIGRFPDSVEEHGFGQLEVDEIIIKRARCKLSDLCFNKTYRSLLTFEQGTLELDVFPKFTIIRFNETYFRNTHLLPKRRPKNCTVVFDSYSATNAFGVWATRFFGESPRYELGSYEIKV